ncbi:DUF4214 domain-containing protein [Sphingobium sp. BYY-5]|uniref:DUF4214 domain-containing protein n=1 Tax=Sphingobium sp. BYY-5 TaxID=2926400 RepID=UPI001FA811F6|nr:DUF4214 domain-containing protein [Sphingobium sp. BYY-5]MCI4589701.1 DUF4214 domain-containing protein [Sphingobium sp. BYY-5]
MSLNDLLALNGIAFLQSAYELILQRDIDDDGRNYYCAKMLAGMRKYEVISTLVQSAEARKTRAVVQGMKQYLARQRWADMPVVGWIVRRFYEVESDDSISRQVRALQMQLAINGPGVGPGHAVQGAGDLSSFPSFQHVEPFHVDTAYSVLDVTCQEDLSAETIAVYALLKRSK